MPDWKPEIEKQLSDLRLEPVREAEIVEELSQHLEDRYRELLAGGAAEAEALQITLDELRDLSGDLQRVERGTDRESRIAAGAGSARMLLDYGRPAPLGARFPLGKWLFDIRYAWRSLSVRRGSSLATALVFALGVGLASAMFALTDPYILRPLPFEDAGRLVIMTLKIPSEDRDAKIPTLDEWRARANLFKRVAAMGQTRNVRLRLPDGSVLFSVREVTENFFEVLGTAAPRSAAWRYERNESVLPVVLTPEGRRVLSGRAVEAGAPMSDAAGTLLRVDGMLPGTFVYPDIGRPHGLAPYAPEVVVERWWSADGSSWGSRRNLVIARLQPGVTPGQVEQALTQKLPSGRMITVTVERLSDRVIGKMRPLAYGAFGAGILVLLVCAGNVANLFLARTSYRAREFATREALGANRADIGRLWLTELALTAALSVAGGIAIAWVVLAIVAGVIPVEYARLGAPAVTSRVAAFAVFCGAIVVVAGLIPAAFLGRLIPRALMGQSVSAAGRRLRFLRPAFGALQAALAMVLAIGAAMLIQSYINLQRQDTGYDPDTIVLRASYPAAHGPALEDAIQESIRRLRAIPGIQSVSATTKAVGEGQMGGAVDANGKPVFAFFTYVMPGFFDVAGMSLRQGRPLEERDRGWRAVVVNERFARTAWPDAPPLGQFLLRDKNQVEVVGVVGDAFDSSLDSEPKPTVYVLQTDSSWSAGRSSLGMDLQMVYLVRGSGSAEAYAESFRRALAGVNRNAVIQAPTTLGANLADSVRDRTFATLVLALFSIAGGAVTLAGLAGIVTFVIARQTKEMAIRVALGAGRRHIRHLAIREAAWAACIGGAAGVLVGQWLSGWLKTLVYGLTAGNWTTTLVAGAVMFAVMVAAALWPAGRAVRLQPTEALRVE